MTSYIHQLRADVIEPICQATFPFTQPRLCKVCCCPVDGMVDIIEAILLRKNYEKVVLPIVATSAKKPLLNAYYLFGFKLSRPRINGLLSGRSPDCASRPQQKDCLIFFKFSFGRIMSQRFVFSQFY